MKFYKIEVWSMKYNDETEYYAKTNREDLTEAFAEIIEQLFNELTYEAYCKVLNKYPEEEVGSLEKFSEEYQLWLQWGCSEIKFTEV